MGRETGRGGGAVSSQKAFRRRPDRAAHHCDRRTGEAAVNSATKAERMASAVGAGNSFPLGAKRIA